MEVTMFLSIAAGQFWLMAGIWTFPSGFRISFKNCPEALFPSGFLTTFLHFLVSVQQPLRPFPSR
jgi:hypothetical protein